MLGETLFHHQTLRKESNNSILVQHTRQVIVAPAPKDRLAKAGAISVAQEANSDRT